MNASKGYLTKSRYLAGLQCAKRLWLQCYEPAPLEPPVLEPPQAVGIEIGRKARLLFPGGVAVETPPWRHAEAVKTTARLMRDRDVPAIFEAAFEHDDVRIRVDVLERRRGGAWGLYEVKSSLKVKDEHLDEVAIQAYLLRQAGVKLGSVRLVHVNGEYVRGPDGIDWRAYFTHSDVAREVGTISSGVPERLAEMKAILRRRAAPPIEPARQCGNPYDCEFWERCTEGKPEDWVFYLPGLSNARLLELHKRGIRSIGEIPDDFRLTWKQGIVRDAHRAGKPYVSPDLWKSLKDLGPPACYLDFECMVPAIPLYPGTSPFQKIPFQWSLHRADAKGHLRHDAFLADGRDDPRPAFVESLLRELKSSKQPIIVYGTFERHILSQLRTVRRDLHPALDGIIDRLADLLAVVRAHVYHPGFLGSNGLKNVAPALVPGLGYEDLGQVADGGAAAAAFERIAAGRLLPEESEEDLRAALLEYCKRDTLALAKLHRTLRRLGEGVRRLGAGRRRCAASSARSSSS